MTDTEEVPFHEHDDRDIREALAQALGERKIRITDSRMLLLYLVVVALLVWVGVAQEQSNEDRRNFERMSVENCLANRANTIQFNDFIDRIVGTYKTSPVLTPKERAQRVAFFDGAKQHVPNCPPEVQ